VGSGCMAIAWAICCFGVVKLRRSRPDQPRPYRAPGGIITAGVGLISSLFMLFLVCYQPIAGSQRLFPVEWIIIIVWVALGILFWILAHKIRAKVSEAERRTLILGRSACE
jgi:amino acid transporter